MTYQVIMSMTNPKGQTVAEIVVSQSSDYSKIHAIREAYETGPMPRPFAAIIATIEALDWEAAVFEPFAIAFHVRAP